MPRGGRRLITYTLLSERYRGIHVGRDVLGRKPALRNGSFPTPSVPMPCRFTCDRFLMTLGLVGSIQKVIDTLATIRIRCHPILPSPFLPPSILCLDGPMSTPSLFPTLATMGCQTVLAVHSARKDEACHDICNLSVNQTTFLIPVSWVIVQVVC